MTRDKLLQYVAGLEPELQKIHEMAERFELCQRDTLSDDYQIAAEVLAVFERYAQRREHE